jgi:2-dehydro-3-deoxyglucarate aldolase
MKSNTIKKRIKKSELTLGTWVTIGHSSIVEILAQADFDWLTIDIEHNLIDQSSLQHMIIAGQAANKAVLVRVPKNEEVYIKHSLDAGADGVIVPMINSAEDAHKAVAHSYYPPFGTRGVGLSRAQGFGKKFNEYKDWSNENLIVIAQIEHKDAIENLEEIAEVKGIDAMMIGPYDLSASMGYPGEFDLPIVKEAMDKFTYICESKKMPRGLHIVPIETERYYTAVEQGYSFIAFGTDFQFLNHSLAQLPKFT